MGDFSRVYRSELTDSQIKRFWHTVRECGRDRTILFDIPPVDEDAFCKWFRSDCVAPWIITFKGVPVGMFYLTNKSGKTAYCHFVGLPVGTVRVGKLPLLVAAGRYAISKCLLERNGNGGFIMDTLIGVTPAFNRTALKFIYRLGAKYVATIPGACFFHDSGENVPGVVTILTRGE